MQTISMKKIHTALLLITALSFADIVTAQSKEKVDPLLRSSLVKKTSETAQNSVTSGVIEVLFEVFSLPQGEAAPLLRSDKTDRQLYDTLVKSAEQETLIVTRSNSGEKALNTSNSECIFPTEYEQGEIPEIVGVQIAPARAANDNEKKKEKNNVGAIPNLDKLSEAPSLKEFNQLIIPAMPTSFETRHTGWTISYEATIGKQSDLIKLAIQSEFVYLEGYDKFGKGVSECLMPRFEARTLEAAHNTRIGMPYLIGTMNHSPFSKLEQAGRISFAMVTVKNVKQ